MFYIFINKHNLPVYIHTFMYIVFRYVNLIFKQEEFIKKMTKAIAFG